MSYCIDITTVDNRKLLARFNDQYQADKEAEFIGECIEDGNIIVVEDCLDFDGSPIGLIYINPRSIVCFYTREVRI